MNDSLEFGVKKSKSATQPYYWRILATKHNKLFASSETYVNKQDCVDAVALVRTNAASATVWDMTGDKPEFVVY